MSKKLNKIIAIALNLVLLFSFMTHPLYAATRQEETPIMPQWQNATNMILSVDLTSPQIKVSATVTGFLGTTYSNGSAVLEKISGSNCGTVKTWTNISSNTPVLQFTDNTVTRTSGTYRLTFTVTTVRNGVSETISSSKEATY